MNYSYDYKLQCVLTFMEGKVPKIPEGLNREAFLRSVRFRTDCYKKHGHEGLKEHPKMHQWSYEKKLECIMKIAAGATFLEVGINYCVNPDQIRLYFKKYQKFGKIGLNKEKIIYQTKVPSMTKVLKKKKSEMTLAEKVKMLEEKNLRLEAENIYLKKLEALAAKKKATSARAKKQK